MKILESIAYVISCIFGGREIAQEEAKYG